MLSHVQSDPGSTSRRHSRMFPYPTKHPPTSHSTSSVTSSPHLDPSPSLGERHFSSRANAATSRILTTVRRSLSSYASKKRHVESSKCGFYSSIEERNQRFGFTHSQFRYQDACMTRPTVQQIAMGLHISRTPHLRPTGRHRRNPTVASQASRLSRGVALPIVHPPPPTRSSLKKSSTLTSSSTMTPATTPVLSAASMSTSTIASITPSIAKSTRSIISLKTRMSRFLPRSRSFSAPVLAPSSPVDKPVDMPRKKAVRFSTSALELIETNSAHRG